MLQEGKMNYQLTILEQKIKSLYETFGINSPSQLDFLAIASLVKIPVYIGKWDSKVVKFKGTYRIVINKNLSSKEQWEVFVHELCHVLNHCGTQLNMPKPFIELQEYQANNFMFHFCVPTFMLLKLELPQYKNQAIKMISDTFNVTLEFAEKRFGQFENKLIGLEFYERVAENSKIYSLTEKASQQESNREIDLYDDVPPWKHPEFLEFLTHIPYEERDQLIWDMKSAYYQRELEELESKKTKVMS